MRQKKESTIKDLDYSSPDCQLLIREYTKLIHKMTKKYDELVAENNELRFKLKQANSLLTISAEDPNCKNLNSTNGTYLEVENEPYRVRLFYLIKKLWRTLHLYGWKITVQKVKLKIRGKWL